MRFQSVIWLFLALFASATDARALLPAGAGPSGTGLLELSARTPTGDLPLAHLRITDGTGRTWTADSEGKAELADARGDLSISLDSPHFQVLLAGRPLTRVLPASALGRGNRLVLDGRHFPVQALTARAHLERVRAAVLEAYPAAARIAWFGRAVPVRIDYDEGCNAAWDGTQLVFQRGDERCQAAGNVPDLAYHEYGHGVLDHVVTGVATTAIDLRLSEGFADALALMMSGDAKFARGFYVGRGVSWLRDLSLPKVFPRDYRGTYTGAGTYSSAWFELRRELVAGLGEERGPKTALKLLLESVATFAPAPGQEQLEAAAQAAVSRARALSAGLGCAAERIFAAHGLASPSPACRPAARAPVAPACAERESVVELASGQRIPDGLGTHAPGPWLEIEARAQVPAGRRISGATLELETDHSFPDDLLVGWNPGSGPVDFYKGEEELALPPLALPPEALARLEKGLALALRDLERGNDGAVLAARLRIRTVSKNCR